jgi:hypothetical protein
MELPRFGGQASDREKRERLRKAQAELAGKYELLRTGALRSVAMEETLRLPKGKQS